MQGLRIYTPSLKTKIFAPKNDGTMLVSGRATSLIKKSPKSSLELQFEIYGSIFFQELLDFFSPVYMQGGPPGVISGVIAPALCKSHLSGLTWMRKRYVGKRVASRADLVQLHQQKPRQTFSGRKKTTFTWTFNSLGINPESR